MAADICPWLGTDTDPEIRYAEPDDVHVCHAQEPVAEIELAYQARFCLEEAHETCPFYRSPPAASPEPRSRKPAVVEDEVGPLEPGLPAGRLLLWFWLVALLLGAVVNVVYVRVLKSPLEPEPTPGASVGVETPVAPRVTASPTGQATPSPSPSPIFAFVEPTATPTPIPGGSILSLVPEQRAVGWVASDEERGNHMGDSYLYSGVFDSVVYHGAFQFDLSIVPRGATIHTAVLEISGLDARRLGADGVWEVRVLDREIDDDWPRVTYQAVHNAAVEWSLSPPLGVADTVAGETNVFELPRELLREVEQRLLEERYTLSFRLDGPQVGDNNVFAWDTGYGPASQGKAPRLLLNVGPAPLTPIPTGTPPFVVVTSTPTPANVLTAAVWAHTATAVAETTGQPTATSVRQWTATPQRIVTNTPTPAAQATADYWRAVATAIAFTTGTFTPVPENVVTATQTPVLIPVDELTPTPTPLPPTPSPPLPPILQGKILFLSNRAGGTRHWAMDADGFNVALLTAAWPYEVAAGREALSPDGSQLAFTGQADGRPAVLALDMDTLQTQVLVAFESGQLSSPVWSPQGDLIAFASSVSGRSQIWLVTGNGTELRQLTADDWGAASHPSFSPDGGRLVYASADENGRRQVWSITVSGDGRINLSFNAYDEWAPIWAK